MPPGTRLPAARITLGSITNNANLNFRLSALEEEGTLKILSSPKILTLDNREAHIEQGRCPIRQDKSIKVPA